MKETLKTSRFLVLALVLLSLGLMIYVSQQRNRNEPVDRMFYVDPDQEVVEVVLDDRQGHVVSLKKAGEGWELNNQYGVNEPAMEELLATLHNLRVRFPVPQALQDSIRRDVEQSGILVQVYARQFLIPLPGERGLLARRRLVRALLVGRNATDGDGTYMMVAQRDEVPFVVHVPGVQGGLREVFTVSEALWRDPVLIDLEPNQIRQVALTWPQQPEQSFELQTGPGGLQILAGSGRQPLAPERIDQGMVFRYLSGFQGLYYERLLTAKPDTMMYPEPFLELQVVDYQNQTHRLVFFRRKAPAGDSLPVSGREVDPDRFYIQLENGQLALAQYFVFNRIMRPVSYFGVEQEESTD